MISSPSDSGVTSSRQHLIVRLVAGEYIGLDGGANRHHLVRVDASERFAAEKHLDLLLHSRHACRAADHYHFLNVLRLEAGILECTARGCQRALDQRIDQLDKHRALERSLPDRAIGSQDLYRNSRCIGQCLFGGTCITQQTALQLAVGVFAQASFLPHPVGNGMIHVVATQRRIASRGQHFEYTAIQTQYRDIEGSTTQIVDRKHAFGIMVKAVGYGGRRWLVEQAQHIQAGEARSILGGLALGVVKIGGHSDYRATEFPAKRRSRRAA